MSSQQLAIGLSNVSKRYVVHHEKPTLVEKFVKRDETFWALQNINLEVKRGERVGIVGPNGSGKTTLLKIIAGITTPTSGRVAIQGKVVSLIDLEAGFHPELTGEQNVFLNGMLLGMSGKEIIAKLGGIIRFADIGQFIDAPLFTYSSGMILRLGFSVLAASHADIFILDEGVSFGDRDFQKKSQKFLDGLFRKNKTVLLASHWPELLKKTCRRILIVDQGQIAADGSTTLIDQYQKG